MTRVSPIGLTRVPWLAPLREPAVGMSVEIEHSDSRLRWFGEITEVTPRSIIVSPEPASRWPSALHIDRDTARSPAGGFKLVRFIR